MMKCLIPNRDERKQYLLIEVVAPFVGDYIFTALSCFLQRVDTYEHLTFIYFSLGESEKYM